MDHVCRGRPQVCRDLVSAAPIVKEPVVRGRNATPRIAAAHHVAAAWGASTFEHTGGTTRDPATARVVYYCMELYQSEMASESKLTEYV